MCVCVCVWGSKQMLQYVDGYPAFPTFFLHHHHLSCHRGIIPGCQANKGCWFASWQCFVPLHYMLPRATACNALPGMLANTHKDLSCLGVFIFSPTFRYQWCAWGFFLNNAVQSKGTVRKHPTWIFSLKWSVVMAEWTWFFTDSIFAHLEYPKYWFVPNRERIESWWRV